MEDFFISYNGNDKKRATWIAGVLEENGYSTFIQEWDILPGHNFIEKMNEASKECECTIAVISQNYVDALYTHPEWHAALREDPRSLKRKLIPIRIDNIDIQGLLGSIVYIDLVGHEEESAKEVLLKGVSKDAPERKAPFPGRIEPSKPKSAVPHPDSSINLAFNSLRIGDINELVGREKSMAWLEKDLLENDRKSTVALASLQGMGGMGKTFLAQAFVEKHGDRYTFLPVYLGDKTPFDAGIELLTRLNVSTEEVGDSPDKLRSVLGQYYQSQGSGIVVLDDVRTDDAFLLVPDCVGWRVLLTTRDKGLAQKLCGSRSHVQELDVLSHDEVLELFRKILGNKYLPDQEETYKQVSVRLACRPYALRLAAGCMLADEFDPSPKAFLNSLQEGVSLKGEGATAMDDLGVLIKHCLLQLKEKSEKSFTYLKYLAVCSDEGIEDKRFISWQAESEQVNEGAVKEELLCAHSQGILLIEKGTQEFFENETAFTRIRLHTDTLDIFREKIPDDMSYSLIEYLKHVLVDRDTEEKLDRLLQTQIYSLLNTYKKNTEIISDIYNTFFAHLYKTSNLQYVYELGEAMLETTNPEDDQERYQTIIGNQALILKAWGRLDEAMKLHKKKEEICEELGNFDGLSQSYGNQALILDSWGRLDEAMELHKEKEDICEKLRNLDSLQISYGNQAVILQSWGWLDEAMALYKKKEEICEKVNKPLSLSICRWNIGLLYRDQKRHDEAIAMFESAIELREKLKSPDLEDDKKYLEEYRNTLDE